MRLRAAGLITLAVSLAASCGFAPRANAAGMLVADGPMGSSQLAIQSHDVHVTINNGIAVTHVTQVFVNGEDRQVEALYTFPVPKGASVSNFSMWINGKEMVGEVVEKQRAREIYNSYKQVRRDPGLLEQTSYRTFEMRVAPIAPRAQQKVEVTYYQQLDFDHDWATYTYPLATNTRPDMRSDLRATTAGKFSLTLDAKSAIPIAEMSSPSHPKDFAIAQAGEKYQQASLEVTGGDLTRDVVLAYHTARPHTGIDLVTSRSKSEDGYFYLTLTAGEELAAMNSGMDYVFILDVSGSMNDDGKLKQSQHSLDAFVQALGADDRFEVMTFNNQAHPLFGALQKAADDSKAKATEFLDSQTARGGTVLSPAMTAAYKYVDAGGESKTGRPLNVVILSDGLTENGETSNLIKLMKERPGNTRVFCIGVGNDVNRALLESIANDSGGLAAFLSREDDFTRQAAAFRRKLLRPAATDLKIDLAGADVYDVEPQKLPNLYYGMPVRVYGRYKKAGNATVNVSANVAGKPLSQSLTVDLPKQDENNPEIERMWAWNRIDRLQKDADAKGAGRDAVTPEIVRLGEGYSIVTEYTSFLVLENDAEFQRWKIDRKNVLRVARDRAAEEKVASELTKLRDQAAASVGPIDEKSLTPASAPPPAARSAPSPAATPAASPSGSTPAGSPAPTGNSPQSRDITFGGGGGGGGGGGAGAIDPFSAAALLAVGGWGLLAGRLNRREKETVR